MLRQIRYGKSMILTLSLSQMNEVKLRMRSVSSIIPEGICIARASRQGRYLEILAQLK